MISPVEAQQLTAAVWLALVQPPPVIDSCSRKVEEMAKYYASCGSQTLTITADSAQFAAMRLIDDALAAHAWIYEDADLSEQDRRDHLVLEALLHLAPAVRVSERGLGRDDAGQGGVPELIEQ